MKTLKILHLYYDLLNLYGENGNLKFLLSKLKEQQIPYEVEYKSLGEPIYFRDYDIVYIGTGSEQSIKLALDDILKYRQDIYEAMKKSYYIITGDALALFSKEVHFLNGDIKKGLYLHDSTAFENEENIVGEQKYSCSLINRSVIGFQNRKFKIECFKEHHPFIVEVGNSFNNNPEEQREGIIHDHSFATFLTGPFLVRNPYLTDYIIKQICKMFQIEYKQPDTNKTSYIAYSQYLKNFHSK
ncbi:MAG: hypothetical protein IKQ29_00590 [Bacilli bacterium]|jgi:CobQ-like glutamine amidotransferase family enzyme|nr:hypothetical protein [Bacilli bacterium]